MTLKKIKTNAIIFVCAIIILAFLFLSLYNYKLSKKEIQTEILTSSIPLLRDNIYSEIEKSFLPAVGVASVMAHDSFLINWVINEESNSEKVVQFLVNMKTKFNYTSTFFISNETYNYYHYNTLFKKISKSNNHDQWYFDFIESGEAYDLDVDFDEVLNNKLTIFINFRVNDFDGNLIGVTGVGIEMDNFSRFLEEQQEKYNRNIYLVDDIGMIQAHSDKSIIENFNISDNFITKNIPQQLLEKNDNTPLLNVKKNTGESILITSKYLKDINWFLIVEQNEADSLKITNQNFIRTITVGFFLLLTILTLIILVLNYFSSKLEMLAITDPLTGCYNRREFTRLLNRSINRKVRNTSNITLVAIDIDFFKIINDTYGHQFGDKVITIITSLIEGLKRPSDILSRLGGDEFIIIIEDNLDVGITLCRRISNELKLLDIKNSDKKVNVTLSMGVYELNEFDNEETSLNKCDSALYRAKNSGRNKIEV